MTATGTRSRGTGRSSATARRFTARIRRRRLIRSFTVAAGLVAVGGLVWLVAFSGVLAVQNVRVTGVDGELSGKVEAVADVPMGDPLVRVDTASIRARVQEIPEVGGVGVHRSWPSSLTIAVTPRIAVAAVPDGSSWLRADAGGTLFAESQKRPKDLPVLKAPTGDDDRAQAARAAGATVAASLPDRIARLVDGVSAESVASVRLELSDGPAVLWGASERNSHKADVLWALMRKQDDPPSEYDISAPDHPTVTP